MEQTQEALSPLTQVGAAQLGTPSPATNPQGALQTMIMGQAAKRQSYLEQQQEAYNRDLNRYAQMVEQSHQAEDSEAGRWSAIAGGFSSVAPTWGNIGGMLGRGGAEYGKFINDTNNQNLKEQGDLTKLRQNEVRALESKDQNAALTKALYGQNKRFEPRRNADGTTTVFDGSTGLPVGTYGPQDIGKVTAMTQVLAKAAFDKGEYATLDEAVQWAQGEALRLVGSANVATGNRTAPLAGNIGGVPTAEAPVVEEAPGVTTKLTGMDADSKALLQRLIARYRANPNDGTKAQLEKAIAALHQAGVLQLGEEVPQQSASATPSAPPMVKKDIPMAKMKEEQASAVGKDLAKEGTLLNDAMHASNRMIMQLDLLDKLYSTPNMPEGELGPLMQQIRSGVKSLGVDVGKEVGAADMARSIASNFALHLRTGEGQNLLPGAMSNYEDKLLQQMAPVLSLTNEGRLALSQFMKEMARTNARFGHEFNKMTDERGIVSPEWRTRKERVMKEEMARIAEMTREIMKRFQGAQ